MLVIDDNPFSDLLPAAGPRLAALDQLERVIQVGTFAKTLSASLRVGYIAATEEHIDLLTDLKMLTVVNSSGYVERMVNDLIVSGQYRRHLQRLRDRISKARDGTIATLERLGITVFGTPDGGYYLWGELPASFDEIDFARSAAEHGIFIAPGSVFMPEKRAAPRRCGSTSPMRTISGSWRSTRTISRHTGTVTDFGTRPTDGPGREQANRPSG